MKENNLVIDLQYLPPIEYFFTIAEYTHVYFDLTERYQKQSYRNRCRILMSNKIMDLTIPIEKGNKKPVIQHAKIDYKEKWHLTHWRSLQTAYGKSPFFEYYSFYFEKILAKKHEKLVDLNIELINLICKLLQIESSLHLITKSEDFPDSFDDFRSKIHPKKESSNANFSASPYQQVFGEKFVKNLSTVDLIFCEGTNSSEVLRKSILQM
ncbi:WbqC family protein [Aureibacter tunicatorum]|uniref:WbqC-like protein family protein n=1 Tax=Aureibacter tunicatorum TaxID=866807 RepID=A0AAE4BNT7_9BACT|nr:WbqC family protein [Aureibacter tunicatorum]MDR6237189.1 hypothetical protein [Aureibacter tunicatorum]BDD06181.1 hypothetical protein AUTU_36640 [Aureibacter tunicatorum]